MLSENIENTAQTLRGVPESPASTWTPTAVVTENTAQTRRRVSEWTGFSGKTLWDWMHLLALLAIPIVVLLGLGSFWFVEQQSQAYLMIGKTVAEQQHQTDLQIAKDQEQEAELNTYLDQMAILLRDNNLSQSQPGDKVQEIARDWTLAVLLRLDPVRKGIVLQFLYGAGLIMKGDVKVSLAGANLSGAILRGANLAGADLSGSNLSWADLTGASLTGVKDENTIMTHAIMPDGSRS